MFRDDGKTINDETNNATVPVQMPSTDPSLTEFTIDLSSFGIVGLIYQFKVQTYNFNGDTAETNALSVALASLPLKPSLPP